MKTKLVTPVFVAAMSGGFLEAQIPSCYDTSPLDQVGAEIVQTSAPDGAVLYLHKEGEDLYGRAFGGYTLATNVPIASATKWMTAACIMTLVEDGLLSLDDTASTFLPNFNGARGTMTIRQMLSHTSGLPGQNQILNVTSITLEQAVNFIATIPLEAPPGTQFFYGGVSMQVAGRIAEIVTGQSWATLFAERIATPLELTATDYTGLGVTDNPRIGGGARSSIGDYGAFLRMLLRGGTHDGSSGPVRVLRGSSIAEMHRDQTMGAPIASTPQPDDRRYGLGCWIDRENAQGDPLQLSSQGAFGCSPWFDLERGLVGLLLVESRLPVVRPDHDRILAWTFEQVHFAGVRCFGSTTPACVAEPIRFGTDGAANAGDASFTFVVAGAPRLSLGALLVGANLPAAPFPILGIDLLVEPDASLVSVPITSALDGTATLPASLANANAGDRFAAQTVWADACPIVGIISGSHALDVVVR